MTAGAGELWSRVTRRLAREGRLLVSWPGLARRVEVLGAQNDFLLHEVRRLDEQLRAQMVADTELDGVDRVQTRASFDYQWREMPEGTGLPSDDEFVRGSRELVCQMTGFPAEWFAGKRVVDIGCGLGRFTRAMLELGADVTACDQSEWGLRRVRELCLEHGDRLQTRQLNLLEWDGREEFDLAFCFGVVHHTGNTYRAIRNVCHKVAPGGRVFLMVYGFPAGLGDFAELNTYESLRQELRLAPFADRERVLIERFGPELAHGYFDAISPRINDLLTYEEIGELLIRLGFENPRLTLPGRNHHVVADLASATQTQ